MAEQSDNDYPVTSVEQLELSPPRNKPNPLIPVAPFPDQLESSPPPYEPNSPIQEAPLVHQPESSLLHPQQNEPAVCLSTNFAGPYTPSVTFISRLRTESIPVDLPLPKYEQKMKLLSVNHHADKLPEEIVAIGGFILPVFNRERFEIQIGQPPVKPCITVIHINKVNIITGIPLEKPGIAQQNFVTAGFQPPIVGFKKEDGSFNPFLSPGPKSYTHLLFTSLESKEDYIEFVVLGGGMEKHMRTNYNEPMGFILHDFQEEILTFDGHFEFRGRSIYPADTPQNLGLIPGEIIIWAPGPAPNPSPVQNFQSWTKVGSSGALDQYLYPHLYTGNFCLEAPGPWLCLNVWIFNATSLKVEYGIDFEPNLIHPEEYQRLNIPFLWDYNEPFEVPSWNLEKIHPWIFHDELSGPQHRYFIESDVKKSRVPEMPPSSQGEQHGNSHSHEMPSSSQGEQHSSHEFKTSSSGQGEQHDVMDTTTAETDIDPLEPSFLGETSFFDEAYNWT